MYLPGDTSHPLLPHQHPPWAGVEPGGPHHGVTPGLGGGRTRGRFGSHLPGARRLPTGPSSRRPEPGPARRASAGVGASVSERRLSGCSRGGHAPAPREDRERIAVEKAIFTPAGLAIFCGRPTGHAVASDGAAGGKSLEPLCPGPALVSLPPAGNSILL